jgi:hypothetical protein
MTINTLVELKQNPSFQILAKLQACHDIKDSTFVDGPMTRSPLQAIAFLIAWTALYKQDDKNKVIRGLQSDAAQFKLPENEVNHLTIEYIDQLIHDVNWVEIIAQAKSEEAAIDFKLTISVPFKDAFLKEIEKTCNNLYAAVSLHPELVKGSTDTSILQISTEVKQSVKWAIPFEERRYISPASLFAKERSLPVLEVNKQCYKFSESLADKLLNSRLKGHYGCFEVIPGTKEKGYRLYINVDNIQNKQFNVMQPKTIVGKGIYEHFIKTYMVGLSEQESIEDVKVEIQGEAKFDKFGAEAQQKQDVAFLLRGSSRRLNGKPSTPTIIIIHDPIMVFGELGLQIDFNHADQKSNRSAQLDPKDYIVLLTDKQAEIKLLPVKLDPLQAFLRTEQGKQLEDQRLVGQKQEPAFKMCNLL